MKKSATTSRLIHIGLSLQANVHLLYTCVLSQPVACSQHLLASLTSALYLLLYKHEEAEGRASKILGHLGPCDVLTCSHPPLLSHLASC